MFEDYHFKQSQRIHNGFGQCSDTLESLFDFSMFTIRMKTKTDIQDRIYQKWEKHFVVKKDNEAYIKTTNDKDKDVVLSESQCYGMLITVRAAKKGLANEKLQE